MTFDQSFGLSAFVVFSFLGYLAYRWIKPDFDKHAARKSFEDHRTGANAKQPSGSELVYSADSCMLCARFLIEIPCCSQQGNTSITFPFTKIVLQPHSVEATAVPDGALTDSAF